MAGASPKGRAAAGTLPPLLIRGMRRMKRQRVYTYEVSWSHKPASERHVVVRLIAAGAQVVPAERPLDAAGRALFYVAPLVNGPLRGERLEVLVDGRKVQETPLPSRVVSQRSTWMLLLLTFLVPWLWSTYIVGEEGDAPGTAVQKYLTRRLEPVTKYVHKEWDLDLSGTIKDLTDNVRTNLDGLHGLTWQRDKPLGLYLMTFYLIVGLLLLTILSWFFHREKRRRRTTAPVPLPEGEASATPVAPRRASVEAVG
jgi:hypothetical protein